MNENLINIICDESFDNFTVIQLRDAYMQGSNCGKSKVEIRRFIYSQVLRLLRIGLFKKHDANNARHTTYSKTISFNLTEFRALKEEKRNMFSDSTKGMNRTNFKQVTEQLKQFQVDLLSRIAEAEEYKKLYEIYPEFKGELETHYLNAREEGSRLLGKIKAWESVIPLYQNDELRC